MNPAGQSLRLARSRLGRRGVVLVIVLIVVAALALAAYAFSDRMLAHSEATQLSGRQIQARMLVASGAAFAQSFLAQDATSRAEAGGVYDNPGRFQGVTVFDEGEDDSRGQFSIIAPAFDSAGNISGLRAGLENESGRVNLNALVAIDQAAAKSGRQNAARDLLMKLPGMELEIADAILDWIDTDSTPRDYGAEADYYASLNPPYAPKNGPLETVEELLLVRGVTPQLLFGADVNRNGVIDANETSSASSGTASGSSATAADRGWATLFTLHSKESNAAATGEARINLNDTDLQKLSDSLSAYFTAEWVTFILAYRLNGPYTQNEAGKAYQGGQLDLTQTPKVKFAQVLDLIGKKVQVQFAGQREATILAPVFASDAAAMSTYLPELLDRVTVVPATVIPGRININQAPREVLLGIPGLTEDIVDQIIQLRVPEPELQNPAQRHETWLLTQGLVTLDQMRSLLPFVCTSGAVYRAQIVGYFVAGGAASRGEVVFDATQQPPRLLLWRDITHLGRGFTAETLATTGSR
jgi:DNA uptake protein ComE-like DNA-binding protein